VSNPQSTPNRHASAAPTKAPTKAQPATPATHLALARHIAPRRDGLMAVSSAPPFRRRSSQDEAQARPAFTAAARHGETISFGAAVALHNQSCPQAEHGGVKRKGNANPVAATVTGSRQMP